jgi:quaternary ammonium compound-resistance protein SugE
MAWLVLLVSAVFEAIWATALGQSEGLTQPIPTVVFLVALLVSMLGLGWAAKHIPIGTAYAVWTGVGAALTVSYAMLTGDETVSAWKILFIAGIIASVVGLKLVPGHKRIDERIGPGVASGRK